MQIGSHSGPSNVCPKCKTNCFIGKMKTYMPGAINIKGRSTVFNDRSLNVLRQISIKAYKRDSVDKSADSVALII